jgi:hypothetical protein
MMIRSILTAALFAVAPITAVADGHGKQEMSKSEARHAVLTVVAKDLSGLSGEKLNAALSEALILETSAEAVRYHTVMIKNGRVVGTHTSEYAKLRKRPGRAKFAFPSDALPPENELEGFKLEKFAVPALNELLLEKRDKTATIQKLALQAFEQAGATDGIFIVTSWDDMAPGDTTRGLVGFGSWN